jgi:Bacterial mobilisation protein (MobC)
MFLYDKNSWQGDPAPRMNRPETTPTRRKRGRDKVYNPRAHIVQTRLTDDELEAIRTRATAQHMTISEYLRHVALEGMATKRKRKTLALLPVDPALMFELNKIGVNLNQIARLYNSGQPMPEALSEACARFNTLLDRLCL